VATGTLLTFSFDFKSKEKASEKEGLKIFSLQVFPYSPLSLSERERGVVPAPP
jgi:hypothetical protein